ncbi:PucR family transcriptional regulator [Nocardia brasiliensis]|uniref:CdaR family transcriptional regulator n=1 Tax=Nocardia brasiliensis (strain ATCC 700358 / HUJEG-1) TaxID=1133849 RepID=K0EVS9_NOCB7|nr:helix-turn-helix domain-containing protein [Nocardia brasiliensis]AFT99665.1 CdaR family transcriptional regulator [Nocardia brasiliensis ATCC 700358]OCF90599.1 hypothetical protein AW168_11640 [Nocardia brasiliensis]
MNARGTRQRLADRLRAELPEVARSMARAVLSTVPEYRKLPSDLLEAELTHNAEAGLDLFLRAASELRAPNPAELAAALDNAIRRAAEGVPIEAVLIAQHRAIASGWDAVARLAIRPSERNQLLAAVPHLLATVAAIDVRIASRYLRERQKLRWEQQQRRRVLAQAMLSGAPVGHLIERSGIELADQYRAVVFHVAEPTGPGRPRPESVLSHLRAEIEAVSRHALSRLERDGATTLFPAAVTETRLTGLVARLATVTGRRVVAGAAAHTELDGIAAAAETATELARLAAVLHRPTGVYCIDDLALHYQLTRPGPARRWLAELLTPLATYPHLIEVLDACTTYDFDRLAAAECLVVHRNTINYRLHRIAELTGYDPTDPDSAQLFAAAVLVRRLEALASRQV